MDDSLDSGHFVEYDWLETLNGKIGVFAVIVAIIFVVIIILTFIVRIFQFPQFRQQFINYFIDDNTRSVPTRILKIITFLLLTFGFVAVTSYNVRKMIFYPPKLSMTLEENKSFPSMLFCRNTQNPDAKLEIVIAKYYASFDTYVRKNNSAPFINLIKSRVFTTISGEHGDCEFFNGTLFPSFLKQEVNAAGVFVLVFKSSDVIFFMGDTNNDIDWSRSIPQGNKFSYVDVLTLKNMSMLQYTETRTKVLNGTTYRSFQMAFKGHVDSTVKDENLVGIILSSPTHIMTQVLKPSLTLFELFSNIGGYLSIWGVFVFLFGRGKMDPFGFVSRFIFIEHDRAKLLKELGKIKDDRSVKLNISKKEENFNEFSNLNNQTELKNLLAKYYVYMDFYEHAVKTLDV
ncbi:unnamed protein product [Rhizophagus irregularis]|uniref:Uncharacterized protein n=1 Tax=Rhizophagus irregularis TaxID=588596 RepID=A0A2N1NH77_9GLOM|nr:hypothetical protein RhiirC2_709802 [Rhizophagus irregularis]CAB4389299.1 unnamed protein product [Rhizophagus irregularis]CAB5343001.1 unnamed protein product [Rhizophagus irregularis]